MPIADISPFIQNDFSGGMNLSDEPQKIAPNEYALAYNIRTRNKSVQVVKKPAEDGTAPVGKKQGLYAFDNYLLLFNNGNAYYRSLDVAGWTQISGFSMSPDQDRIWTQAVPASTFNYKRRLMAATQISGTSSGTSMLVDPLTVNGTVGGLVCQDGVTQPIMILPDASAQNLQTYEQWSETIREYVPIGKNMAFINGILFIVSPDGKSLYRSVSGRPLDFAVNVDVNGYKGGNAATTSYAPSYSDITALYPLNSGELLVGTPYTCHPLEFNYDSLIFGEPTFLNRKTIYAGIVNQWSIVDNLGDSVFIDFDGLRSFNAVSQNTNEGRNSIFSERIDPLLEGARQDSSTGAAIAFEDYLLFSIRTKKGYGVAVYDMVKGVWQCMDRYNIGAIKQFAVATYDTNPRLFAITDTKLYEVFAGTDYASGMLSTGAFTVGDARGELKTRSVRCVFSRSDAETQVRVTEQMNEMLGATVKQTLPKHSLGIKYPVTYPVKFSGNFVTNLHFNFNLQNNMGSKLAARIEWASGAKLDHVQIDAEIQTPTTSQKQQTLTYAG